MFGRGAKTLMSSDDDSIPTSDVIEGAKHPSEAAAVIGHQDAENLFVDALNEGRLHHAWMITGPKGIGKPHLLAPCKISAVFSDQEEDHPCSAMRLKKSKFGYRP